MQLKKSKKSQSNLGRYLLIIILFIVAFIILIIIFQNIISKTLT